MYLFFTTAQFQKYIQYTYIFYIVQILYNKTVPSVCDPTITRNYWLRETNYNTHKKKTNIFCHKFYLRLL